MGNDQSNEAPPEELQEESPDLKAVLQENTYYAGENSKYPYFLIQLTEKEELDYNGALVSDAICEYIRENDVTHIIAQTHGWNTPPDKAVAVPFTEFIAGMQNDRAMPSEEFNPIFVAFIWQAVPITFMKIDDALTRAELLAKEEREQAGGEDTDIATAADAARAAMEEENPDNEELMHQFRNLSANARDDDDDDDEDDDQKVERARRFETPEDEDESIGDKVADLALGIINPLQNLVFGRLMSRGQRTGKIMEQVLAKLMDASGENRAKVCLMANSLGAHVLAGILKDPQHLPYKVHTVFFVQGAIKTDMFAPGGKFEQVVQNVAGPIICSYSDRDLMLKNVFGAFHGWAVGLKGFPIGESLEMKSLEEMEEEPYELKCGELTSVNGTRFIDEGNAVAGGHGDFKEDETTSLYWCAIKTPVDPEGYEL